MMAYTIGHTIVSIFYCFVITKNHRASNVNDVLLKIDLKERKVDAYQIFKFIYGTLHDTSVSLNPIIWEIYMMCKFPNNLEAVEFGSAEMVNEDQAEQPVNHQDVEVIAKPLEVIEMA